MSIRFQILGQPGRDNCLHVTVDSGQRMTTLLFDCGAGCLDALSISDVMSIDHLCFSHLHMDHVSGFDHFFRVNYARTGKPNYIYGPAGSARIMQHRMQGYWWNLISGSDATWHLIEIEEGEISSERTELSERFEKLHFEYHADNSKGIVIDDADFVLRGIQLGHHGPCIAWRLDEKPKTNVDQKRLGEMKFRPGPWLQKLKTDATGEIEIAGQSYDLEQLRAELVVQSTGDSLAYLTDFLLDESTHARLVDWLGGCQHVVCEAQYGHADLKLAVKNHHTTTRQAARLALDAGIRKLHLFHLSDRYDRAGWSAQLSEAQAIFPATDFPEHWSIS